MASKAGARVLAGAKPADFDSCRAAGASEVADYADPDLAAVLAQQAPAGSQRQPVPPWPRQKAAAGERSSGRVSGQRRMPDGGQQDGRASLNGGHTPFSHAHLEMVHASVGYPPRQTAYSGQSGRPVSGELIHSRRRCR